MTRLRLLYRILDRVQGRSVVPRLDEALARQTGPHEAVSAHAEERLRGLLDHCLKQVPFYRERLRLVASDAETLAGEAFRSIPPLDKPTIAEAGDRILADRGSAEGPGVTQVTSGGTTGPPTRVLIDRDTLDAQTAATLRSFLWFGADPTSRHALLWGPPPGDNTYASPTGRLKGAILRRTLMPTFDLDQPRARRYWERLLAGRWNFLAGYSSALVRIAETARPGEHCRIAAGVIAAAEPVFDFQTTRIAEAFGAPVRERYGSNEFALMAQQCAGGGYHVAADRVRLEIVREDGSPAAPGEIGTVLVTDLDNRLMPLVRYRIGDLAAWGAACECGLPFPTLEKIHGRLSDALLTPEGRVYSPHRVASELTATPARGFQLIADEAGRLREVHLVSEPFPVERQRERWSRLAGGADLVIRFVEDLRRSGSGKILPVLRTGA